MTTITRRTALKGGAATVAIAAVPTMAVADDDAELLRLEADWWQARAAHHAADELGDPAGYEATWERWRDVEKRMRETPANTPVGIAAKLRIWKFWQFNDHMDSDDYLVTSCLADAERLAAGGAI